jgi:hypothetical protein
MDISRCHAFAEGTLALADANSCYNFGGGIGRERTTAISSLTATLPFLDDTVSKLEKA